MISINKLRDKFKQTILGVPPMSVKKYKGEDKKVIWKYVMEQQDQTFDMPDNAEFLNAQNQMGHIALWFLVDPDQVLSRRRFNLVGTGREMPEGEWHYLATVKVFGEGVIGHLWEAAEVEQTQECKKLTGRDSAQHPC